MVDVKGEFQGDDMARAYRARVTGLDLFFSSRVEESLYLSRQHEYVPGVIGVACLRFVAPAALQRTNSESVEPPVTAKTLMHWSSAATSFFSSYERRRWTAVRPIDADVVVYAKP